MFLPLFQESIAVFLLQSDRDASESAQERASERERERARKSARERHRARKLESEKV
jgi:hypothetical protein